jgi:hypothetical protein
MGKGEVCAGVWWGDLWERNNLEDLIKWTSNKWDGEAWTGLVWTTTGAGGGLL